MRSPEISSTAYESQRATLKFKAGLTNMPHVPRSSGNMKLLVISRQHTSLSAQFVCLVYIVFILTYRFL